MSSDSKDPAGKPWLVFVSHSGTDLWVAKQLESHLRIAGADVFLDESGIDVGDDFEEKIRTHLEKMNELLVLLTPWALERPYVWAETGAAWIRQIPVIVVLHGLTAETAQTRPGFPVFLKRRDMIRLNEVETYFTQLAARIRKQTYA